MTKPSEPGRCLMRRLAAVLALLAVLLAAAPASAAGDPGADLYTYMHEHGATMPAGWARIVDENQALICHNYGTHFTGWPDGAQDDYGVSVPLAEAALAATGFCGGA